MFAHAAEKYLDLYCHVGGTSDSSPGERLGLGCRVGPNVVVTAAHVFRRHNFPTVLLADGLWKCVVVKEWEELDIALVRATDRLGEHCEGEEPTDFPSIASPIPVMGSSLGYIGWLKLLDDSGRKMGRTYFGQGHVAFSEDGSSGQQLIAVHGSAVELGFSGGPAFTPWRSVRSTGESASVQH
jgi:hypothetical protein